MATLAREMAGPEIVRVTPENVGHSIPPQGHVESHRGRKISLRAAINRFCRSCIVDDREPIGWRQQVGACTASTCPLWAVRPREKTCRE